MRVVVLIFDLACCLLILGSIIGSNALSKRAFFYPNPIDDVNEKSSSSSGSSSNETNNCNYYYNNYYYLSGTSEKKCSNLDDKRFVPTGPNPLHNR